MKMTEFEYEAWEEAVGDTLDDVRESMDDYSGLFYEVKQAFALLYRTNVRQTADETDMLKCYLNCAAYSCQETKKHLQKLMDLIGDLQDTVEAADQEIEVVEDEVNHADN